ncbi:hypothetical protein EKI60_02290 [Candidatus Saccharibacteria bacterium]|nr:MAG: hypothetical protein EKI60_02290 [Candidatus Saccharibacteria bacterium]
MKQKASIDTLLDSVMRIKVLNAGGASPAIFGSPSADSDVIHALKKSAIAFAEAYRNSAADPAMVRTLSDEFRKNILTAQVIFALSEDEASALLDALGSLDS